MDYEDFTTNEAEPHNSWVIPGFLPDAVVILEGRGGLGKSTLITDLAAAITTGRSWPYRKPQRGVKPGGVLLFGHEDRKAVVAKRLKDAGADLTKVRRFTKAHLYSELDELEAHIKRQKAKLVVLDPVQDYLGINVRNPEESRWMLGQLDYLCEKYQCCIVLIRHMRKDSNDQDPMEDGGLGTGQLRNFVRAVFRLVVDPDDDDKRMFFATKFNYGPYPASLLYKWGEKPGVEKLVWDEKPGRWNAFNLLPRPKDVVRRTQAHECDRWLKRYLREHHYRVEANVCLSAGSKLGFPSGTIQRSRVKLNVITQRIGWGKNAQYMWTHPLYNPASETDPEILDALQAERDDEDDDQ
jgi:hypothetical protein